MTYPNAVCEYGSGTGLQPSPQQLKSTIVRGDVSLPLPPFGCDVELRIAKHEAPFDGIDIFCCEEQSHGRDVWQQAILGQKLRGLGSGMVLEPGRAVEDYRWPTIPLGWMDRPQVVVWAFSLSCAQIHDLVEKLHAAGYECVDVRGSLASDASGKPVCPAQFKARQSR